MRVPITVTRNVAAFVIAHDRYLHSGRKVSAHLTTYSSPLLENAWVSMQGLVGEAADRTGQSSVKYEQTDLGQPSPARREQASFDQPLGPQGLKTCADHRLRAKPAVLPFPRPKYEL